MKLKRVSLVSIVEFLFVVSVAISGGTMYGVMDSFYVKGINDFTLRILCMAMSCVLIGIYIINKRIAITRKQALFFSFSVLYFVLYLTVTRYRINSCLEGLCIPFMLFYVLSCLNGSEKFFTMFFDTYSTIFYWLAIISLILFLDGNFFEIFPRMSMEYFNNGWWYPGTNSFFLAFINEWQRIDAFGMTIYKNIGIFMEAPGFAFPLVVSLWWEYFGRPTFNKKHVLVFLITLVSTFSAKGIIIGIFVTFLFMYSKASDRIVFWKRIKRFLILPILGVAILIVAKVLGTKISASTGTHGSWATRVSDVWAAWTTWMEHPFFGVGFYNLPEIYKHYIPERHNGAPTMGLLNVLAFGGIYMFVGYLGGLLRFYLKGNYRKCRLMLRSFLCIVLAFMCTSGIQYNYTLILFIAMGWSIKASDFKGLNSVNLKG